MKWLMQKDLEKEEVSTEEENLEKQIEDLKDEVDDTKSTEKYDKADVEEYWE